MEAYEIAVPFGIAAYGVFWLSVLSGTRVIKVGFKWHRRLGLLGITLASVHAGIMLYFGYLA
jgi:hypothetical protein